MSEDRAKGAASEQAGTTQGFRSLLIASDLTPLADRVLRRVALLPLARSAQLTLLHVVPSTLPPQARHAARQQAQKALAEEAGVLREKLPSDARIKTIVTIASPAAHIAQRAASMRAEMVVMGRGGRTMRDLFLGATAERVIRHAQRPVLAVRLRPLAPYRRPALALDLDDAAAGAVAMLLRLVPPPRRRVAVIHAFDMPYRGLMHSGLSTQAAKQLRDWRATR